LSGPAEPCLNQQHLAWISSTLPGSQAVGQAVEEAVEGAEEGVEGVEAVIGQAVARAYSN